MIKWTYKKLQKETLKYKTRKELRTANFNAYQACLRSGRSEELFSHMEKYSITWEYEAIVAEALKYTTRNKFKKGSIKAYRVARSRGLLDDVCSHMKHAYTSWTKGMLIEEGLKYTSRKDLEVGSPKAYKAAQARGLLDDVCSHMVKKSTTSDNDTIYLWNVPNTNIYKIGVTSARRGETRIHRVALQHNVDYRIVGMFKIPNALEIEKELHDTYTIVPTTLPSIENKVAGYTEFRVLTTKDVNEIVSYCEMLASTSPVPLSI